MIRFLADTDLNAVIVSGCRRRVPAMDFLSASDAGLEGVPDPDVLALALEQGRILVSRFPDDAETFWRLPSGSEFQPGRALSDAILADRRSD